MAVITRLPSSAASKLLIAIASSTLAGGLAIGGALTVVTGSPSPLVWNEVRQALRNCPADQQGAGLQACMEAWRRANMAQQLDRVDRAAEQKLEHMRVPPAAVTPESGLQPAPAADQSVRPGPDQGGSPAAGQVPPPVAPAQPVTAVPPTRPGPFSTPGPGLRPRPTPPPPEPDDDGR